MKLSTIIATIKLSLNGEQQDYTEGNIKKAVVLLAIPMILELSLESIFAVVDIFFVSKLGPNAIATVGLTEAAITIVYSFAIGLSVAATAIVARRTGEKEFQEGAKSAAQAINVGIAISLVITLIGLFFPDEILSVMGASEAVVRDGAEFTRIMLGGNLVIMLLFLINGIFRGAGNAAMAMKSLWIASIINIVLCPILINIYGIKGAAIATVIGRSAGVIYQCIHLFKGNMTLKFSADLFKINFTEIKNIWNIAWPATSQFIIQSGSWIVLTKLVADTGGTEASAGYQIAIRNVVFFILPAWGLSNAAATLVGQNLGANKPDRAEQSVWLAMRYNIYFMGLVMLLFVFFSRFIISIFTNDEALISHGTRALQIMGYGYVFYGISMVMMQSLNGAGDTKTPSWINFCCFWLFQIPLAYVLAYYFHLKEIGALIAVPVAETLLAIVSFYHFKKGKWKNVEV